MHELTEFDRIAEEDKTTIALRELLSFLEKPQSIGIDNLKESLRNIIQLALEIKGYETGLSLQHLVNGEHSSLAPEGISKVDKERKRRLKQFIEDMAEIEREMANSFNIIFNFTVKKIAEIKQEIVEEISSIDHTIQEKEQALEEIKDKAAEAAIAEEILRKKKKRKKLKQFKEHVKKKEAELKEATRTQDVVEIQQTIIEDTTDFKEGRFDPNKKKKRKAPIDLLKTSLGLSGKKDKSSPCDLEYGYDNMQSSSHKNKLKKHDNKSGDDDKSSSSTTDTDEGSSKGGDDKEEIAPPELVNFD